MANLTDPFARPVHGTNPQNLIEYITRQKIYASHFWKDECFGLAAADVAEKAATRLQCIGSSYGANLKPTRFACLALKLLQIQPSREVVEELVQNEDFKYVRALGLFYVRLTGTPADIYGTLEPFYRDYRKLRVREASGWRLTHVDEFVDELLREDRVLGIALPRLPKREFLEEAGYIETGRVTALDLEGMGVSSVEEMLEIMAKEGNELAKKGLEERRLRLGLDDVTNNKDDDDDVNDDDTQTKKNKKRERQSSHDDDDDDDDEIEEGLEKEPDSKTPTIERPSRSRSRSRSWGRRSSTDDRPTRRSRSSSPHHRHHHSSRSRRRRDDYDDRRHRRQNDDDDDEHHRRHRHRRETYDDYDRHRRSGRGYDVKDNDNNNKSFNDRRRDRSERWERDRYDGGRGKEKNLDAHFHRATRGDDHSRRRDDDDGERANDERRRRRRRRDDDDDDGRRGSEKKHHRDGKKSKKEKNKYGSLFKESGSSKSKDDGYSRGKKVEKESGGGKDAKVDEESEEYWNEQRAKLGLKPLK